MTTASRSRRGAALRKGDRNEQAIIETAERLLGSRPLSEVTIEALAKGAGISRSSFYFYFGSKEDVVLSLFDRLAGEVDEAIASWGADIAGDRLESVTTVIEATARVWRTHGPVLQAAWQAATSDERIRDAWQSLTERFVTEVADIIDAERARGRAPGVGPSARQLASVLVSAHQRAYQQSGLGDRSALADNEIDAVMVELFYRAIYAAPAPAGA